MYTKVTGTKKLYLQKIRYIMFFVRSGHILFFCQSSQRHLISWEWIPIHYESLFVLSDCLLGQIAVIGEMFKSPPSHTALLRTTEFLLFFLRFGGGGDGGGGDGGGVDLNISPNTAIPPFAFPISCGHRLILSWIFV